MSQKRIVLNQRKKPLQEKLKTNLFTGELKKEQIQQENLELPVLDTEGNVVPKDPHQFYLWLGKIFHPLTKKEVDSYTSYQLKGWQLQLDSDLLVVKSNKVGYSSSSLDALIQNCLLKNTAGFEKLIVCQNTKLAREHLYTIRKRLIDSDNGARFLVTGPRDYLLEDEVTKVMEVVIDNPYNPKNPNRIFAIGASAGSVVSWKRVNYVLCSDITKSKDDYRPVLDGVGTRLANTRGRLHIETIPNGPVGRVYELYEQIKSGELKDMKLLEITADMAVQEGVITQEYLNQQKERLGPMYGQYFNADFIVGHGNIFLNEEIESCLTLEPAIPNPACSISMGIDPGFGSSRFGITIIQNEDNLLKVLFSKEYERPSYELMIQTCTQLRYQYKPSKIYVDGAKPDFIKSLKIQFNETINYESIIEQAKKDKLNPDARMIVCPVNFNEWGKLLLGRFQHVVSKGWMRISEKEHKALVLQMRMAKYKENMNLDKDEDTGITYDALDSARLALKMFPINERIK